MHPLSGLPYSSHKCASVSDQSSGRLSDSAVGLPPQLSMGADGRKPQVLVLKVGTSTLMTEGKHSFSLANLGKFVDAVCDLKERGYHVVMISSGAVGSGCVHMHMRSRPKRMVEKQAISAIGQCRLVRLWEDIFAIREQKVAQLLVTRTDLIDRPRFVNFRNTLLQLLNMNCIPIINENDALAAEGLKFGDNDTLGAYVSIAIGANWFFMLTDVDCLFTANPRHHADAKPIAYVGKISRIYQLLDADENDGTQWGSGGMRTKIIAAKVCCATGIHTALCHGAHPDRILDMMSFAERGSHRRKDSHEPCAQAFPVQPLTQKFIKNLQKASHQKEDSATPSADNTTSSPTTDRNAEMLKLESAGNEALNLPAEPSQEAETPSSSEPAAAVSTADKPAELTLKLAPSDDVSKCAFVTFPSVESMPYLGTIFAGQPCTQALRDQRRWILSLPVRGRIYIDEATCRAVFEKRKSLFAYGICHIKDEFYPGEAVALYLSSGNKEDLDADAELARCLVNFSSQELQKIAGKKSSEFQRILGYYCAHEVAHKSDIIFVNPSPVYERYEVKITREMVESSDDEAHPGLEQPSFSPVPLPATGIKHRE